MLFGTKLYTQNEQINSKKTQPGNDMVVYWNTRFKIYMTYIPEVEVVVVKWWRWWW